MFEKILPFFRMTHFCFVAVIRLGPGSLRENDQKMQGRETCSLLVSGRLAQTTEKGRHSV